MLTPAEYSWVVNAKRYITKNENMLVAGTDNYVLQGSMIGSGNIVGYKNYTNKSSYVFGQNNTSIGNYGVAIGYQNGIIGNSGIAMGNTSVTGAGGIAIGSWALSHNLSIALGRETLATGESSLAIGDGASAGTSSAIAIYRNSDEGWGSGWTTNQPFVELQKDYPNIFGSYDENQDSSERDREVQQKIFDLNKNLFKKQGINSLDELLSKAKKYNTTDTAKADSEVESILSQLGWQYAMTQENVTAPIALGKWSKALSDNSVALGAYSAVTKADMDETTGTLSKPAPFSGITLRQSGNLGSEGNNANGEYLTGAISIGGPRYVQKNVNGNMQVVQEGNYVRQIKHLADGTDPTDAVNLRQLQGLETKLSQGNTSPKTFALAGDIGMATSDKTVANKTITKELGNTINIVGGVVAKTDVAATDNNDATAGNGEATTPATTPTITEAGLTDNNIGVVSDGKDTLTIKLANTLKGITSIEGAAEANGKLSFTTDALTLTRTTGGTTASIIMGTQGSGTEATQGIHLSYGDAKVRVDANGLDVGNKQIHSVQSGMATSASHTDSETSDSTTSSGDTDTNNESNGNKEGSTAPSYTLAVSKLADNDTRLTNAANIGDLRTAAQGLEEKINDLDTSFNTTVNGLKPITVIGDKEVKNTDGSSKYPNGVITTEAVKDSNNKITGYIVKADLSAYAKTSILNQYITQEDLKNYIDQSTLDAKLEKYAKLDASNLTDENNIKAWKEKLGVTAPPEVKGGSLDYSANGDNKQTIDLDKDGLNFVDGTNTTATVGANGEVKYDLKSKLTGIESIKGKDNTKGELKFTAEGVALSHQTDSRENSLSVGDAIKATVGTNSLTVGNSIEAKSGSNSFTLSDNDLKAVVGQAHMTIDKEKWETVFNDATSTIMKDTSITTTAGKSTLALSDTTSTLTVGTKETGSTVMNQTTDKVAWTVTGKATDGKPAPTATISITAEGLDVGKTIIHNLADGKAPTDAATVGQLTTAKEEFNTRITKLDRRVDKVGAGAAALAALHPLDFDPGNKWDIAGGWALRRAVGDGSRCILPTE